MLSREPVLVALAGLSALVAAVLAVGRAFGLVPWDAGQITAVVGLVTVMSGFVGSVLRAATVPVGQVQPRVEGAYESGFQEGLWTPVPDAVGS